MTCFCINVTRIPWEMKPVQSQIKNENSTIQYFQKDTIVQMFIARERYKLIQHLNKTLALKKKGFENGKWMEQRNNQFWQCRGKLITTNALMVDIGGCAICCIFWQIASLYLSQKMSPLLRSTKLLSHHILSLYSKQQQLWLNLVKQEGGGRLPGNNYSNSQQKLCKPTTTQGLMLVVAECEIEKN